MDQMQKCNQDCPFQNGLESLGNFTQYPVCSSLYAGFSLLPQKSSFLQHSIYNMALLQLLYFYALGLSTEADPQPLSVSIPNFKEGNLALMQSGYQPWSVDYDWM